MTDAHPQPRSTQTWRRYFDMSESERKEAVELFLALDNQTRTDVLKALLATVEKLRTFDKLDVLPFEALEPEGERTLDLEIDHRDYKDLLRRTSRTLRRAINRNGEIKGAAYESIAESVATLCMLFERDDPGSIDRGGQREWLEHALPPMAVTAATSFVASALLVDALGVLGLGVLVMPVLGVPVAAAVKGTVSIQLGNRLTKWMLSDPDSPVSDKLQDARLQGMREAAAKDILVLDVDHPTPAEALARDRGFQRNIAALIATDDELTAEANRRRDMCNVVQFCKNS